MSSKEPTDNDLLHGALSGLDLMEPQLDETIAQDQELPSAYSDEPRDPESPETESLTLQQLDPNRRPKVRTVCEGCRNSVWFTTPQEVKCYCRVMYLITWSNKEPTQFTGCDGLYIGDD